nr:MAG TPA: hypothetical protein [Caudoviricetes sp.]
MNNADTESDLTCTGVALMVLITFLMLVLTVLIAYCND